MPYLLLADSLRRTATTVFERIDVVTCRVPVDGEGEGILFDESRSPASVAARWTAGRSVHLQYVSLAGSLVFPG
jgi:hypothetical protein